MSSHRYSTRSSRTLPPRSPSPQGRRSRRIPSSATSRRPPAGVVSVSAASAENSSDEFEFSDADNVAPKTTGSVTSTGSKGTRKQLSLNIQKTVLQDIENSGGIGLFTVGQSQALAKLLDNPERATIYGNRGDKIRRKISQWIHKLKQWPRDKYLEKCLSAGVARVSNPSATASRKQLSSPPQVISTSASTSVSKQASVSTPVSELRPTNLSFTQYRDPTRLIQFHDKKEDNMASGEFI